MAEMYSAGYSMHSISKRELAVGGAAVVGGLVGALQTIVLREFVDTPMAKSFMTNTSNAPPLLMKEMGGFGSASALAGIVAGGAALVVGLVAALKGKLVKNGAVALGLVSYGAVAATTGILSGALPTNAWQAAIAVDPSNPVKGNVIRRNAAAAPSAVPISRSVAAATLGA